MIPFVGIWPVALIINDRLPALAPAMPNSPAISFRTE